jgi:hypothetical protein
MEDMERLKNRREERRKKFDEERKSKIDEKINLDNGVIKIDAEYENLINQKKLLLSKKVAQKVKIKLLKLL